jgi:Ni2+-binding GTPase involved in maturation of urease and hydrogenase
MDHEIHNTRHKALGDLKEAILNPGDTGSIILSGAMGCGKTSLIQQVLKRLDEHKLEAEAKKIDVFPRVIHPNVLMHGIHEGNSHKDFMVFTTRLEKLLNTKRRQDYRIIVVLEGCSASLFVSLLEWLAVLDSGGRKRSMSYFFIWECTQGDLV